MNITWKRTLRTLSSERFLAQRNDKDVAAVDIHYLTNGHASGTVILLREAGGKDEDVSGLLSSLDDHFLPDVDLSQGTLTYTVVIGELMGSFEATTESA